MEKHVKSFAFHVEGINSRKETFRYFAEIIAESNEVARRTIIHTAIAEGSRVMKITGSTDGRPHLGERKRSFKS